MFLEKFGNTDAQRNNSRLFQFFYIPGKLNLPTNAGAHDIENN